MSEIETYYDLKKELYRRDFERFAREQLWITGMEPGQILTFDVARRAGQKMLHDAVERQRHEMGWVRVVLIKCRQMGGSTYTAGRAFHLASLNPAVLTMEIAHDGDTAQAIFEKCKMFYNRMNEELRPLTRYDNKTELKFENPDARTRGNFPGLNSKMTFNHAKNLKVGTGLTPHFIHMTETSKFDTEFCELLESSLFPGLHLVPNTWCINESTAYVGGDYFHNCCERARSGGTEWMFVFVPWYIGVEERIPLAKGEKFKRTREEQAMAKLAALGQPDDNVPPWIITDEQFKWRRNQIASREGGELIFKQEYPSTYEEAWINVDSAVFPPDHMYRMREHLKDPTFWEIQNDGKFRPSHTQHMSAEESYFAIWKAPELGRKYDIGVDTSVGIEGGDWSVAEVFERESREQVAELHVLLNGPDLGEQLYWLGIHYNMAQISVEMASTGFTVNGALQRRGYPNLYIWRHRERAFPTLSSYSGWKTNRESKIYAIDMSRDWLVKNQMIIHSHVLWHEMKNFVRVPGSDPSFDQYRGGPGTHDDAVMAMVICLIAGDDEMQGTRRVDPNPDANLTRKEQIERLLASGGPAYSDDFGLKRPSGGLKEIKIELTGWER